ncbi:MAG: class II aldolase/adducin family protein [Actinomycetota bacterium]
MYEDIKKEIIKAALMLKEYRLIALSGGNLSVKTPAGHVVVTPSGMLYETMLPEDVVVIDMDGNTIEGTRKVSVDTEARSKRALIKSLRARRNVLCASKYSNIPRSPYL